MCRGDCERDEDRLHLRNRHQLRVVLRRLAEEQPSRMGPPGSITRRMRIPFVIGKLMVKPMGGHPGDWTAFERHRPTKRQKIFDRLSDPVGPVRM